MKKDQKPSIGTVGQRYFALSPEHRSFCDEYLQNGLNAAAALRVVDREKNPSSASQLLRRKDVQAYLLAVFERAGFGQGEIIARLENFAAADMSDFVSIDSTKRQIWRALHEHPKVVELAYAKGQRPEDLSDEVLQKKFGPEGVAQSLTGERFVVDEVLDGSVHIDWKKARELGALGRIKRLRINQKGVVDFELHDPIRALELLGRRQGMWNDKAELSGNLTVKVDYGD